MCEGGGVGGTIQSLVELRLTKWKGSFFLSSVSNLIMVGNRNFLGGAVGDD